MALVEFSSTRILSPFGQHMASRDRMKGCANLFPLLQRMSRQEFFLLWFAWGLMSCHRGRVITDTPFQVGSAPVRIAMKEAHRSSGPTRELCLDLSPQDADSLELPLIRDRGRRSPIHVVLITTNGIHDTLGGQFGAATLRRNASTICLWDQGLAIPSVPPSALDSLKRMPAKQSDPSGVRMEEYTAVELSSDRPITINAVRWWTGQVNGFL